MNIERVKTMLDVEKEKVISVNQNQNAALSQFVELVYRLRNEFRDKINILKSQKIESINIPGSSNFIFGFGEELYLLTDSLYKFRIFLDDNTFNILHTIKRTLQDANVLFNTISRPFVYSSPEGTLSELTTSSEDNFKDLKDKIDLLMPSLIEKYNLVDKLYPVLLTQAKQYINSYLIEKQH